MADKTTAKRAKLSDLSHEFCANYMKSTPISLKSKQQGYKYFSEGYFHDVSMFIGEENVIQVYSKSYRSQKKSEKPHAIHLDIKADDVIYAHCSCQAGASASCSHLIGLMQALHEWQLMGFTEVPSQLSCKSMPQQWGVPRGKMIESADFYINEMAQPVGTTCGDLKFPKKLYIEYKGQYAVEEKKINDCYSIESNTQKQAECPQWFKERKSRLTASNFGVIMKRKSITDKFVNLIIHSKVFTSSATSYGKANEKKAISKYIFKSGNHVHECGLVIANKFPFLAATPDGKVCENGATGILEIKCPYSARDMSIKDAVANIATFCLEEYQSSIVLKKEHEYYFQVQGQLMVTGAEFCDFVVYTKKDPIHIQRIFSRQTDNGKNDGQT